MLPFYVHHTPEHTALFRKIRRDSKKFGIQRKVIRRTSNIVVKKCKICDIVKTVEVFQKTKSTKSRNGLKYYRSMCRECFNKTINVRLMKERRLKALQKIQTEIKCVRCGCDDVRFLEINHKNGGGGQEQKNNNMCITNRILYHGRKTDDLEIVCKPCNSIHALEMRYGEKIHLTVVWNSSESN